MDWQELGPFTVFDVETTGMSPVYDRIVELAAVRINRDGSRDHFHSLVNPERKIPRGVIHVHHITDDMVCKAPCFGCIAREFLTFAEGSTLVAHNARFDLGFLQESLARCGMPLWEGKTMDSLRLVRTTHPGLPSYKLQDLRVRFHLDEAEGMTAHRAGSDVEWTAQLLGIALSCAMKKCAEK